MITDNELYSLAILLGSVAVVLIVLYHFIEVNSEENDAVKEKRAASTISSKQGAANK